MDCKLGAITGNETCYLDNDFCDKHNIEKEKGTYDQHEDNGDGDVLDAIDENQCNTSSTNMVLDEQYVDIKTCH